MAAVLTLARGIPAVIYAVIIVLVLFVLTAFFSYRAGANGVKEDWNASKERGKAIVEALVQKSGQVTEVVQTKYIDRVEVIREKGETIVQQIPVYIPADTPDLPGGFRLLHDAAATSTFPTSPGVLETAPVGVAEATGTITENYTTCLTWREEALGWREWHQKQSLAWQIASNK